ncbi:hypothetical protein D9611_005335 [Ephemerocybe angulata]|uniref:Uncharacterized protein n=1 Tax=Ephemerocybe angulata TaxID=980116 RepID=A0A8H5FD77_9AGAR|nr:hypothetical protein D9611_005335 [Tulosesus angulatus]
MSARPAHPQLLRQRTPSFPPFTVHSEKSNSLPVGRCVGRRRCRGQCTSTWIGGILQRSIDEGAAILSCTNAFISAVRKIRLEVEWGSEVLVVAAAAVAVKGWSAGNNIVEGVWRCGLRPSSSTSRAWITSAVSCPARSVTKERTRSYTIASVAVLVVVDVEGQAHQSAWGLARSRPSS